AQEELDRVVGTDRLPIYADQEALPYIDAIVKESLRWELEIPLGVHIVQCKTTWIILFPDFSLSLTVFLAGL
ncbi:hypothetical protein B0H13DRAFT_1638001, partial [Mycena leptocephala]